MHGEPAGAAAGLRVVFGQSSADLALSSRPPARPPEHMMSVPISARGQVGQLKEFQLRPNDHSQGTDYGVTPLALILITGSSVVKCAAVRLLGQGKGDGKAAR